MKLFNILMDVEIFVVQIDNKTDIDCYFKLDALARITDLGMNFWIVIDDVRSYIFSYLTLRLHVKRVLPFSRDPACGLLRNSLRRDENCYAIAFCRVVPAKWVEK